MNSTGLILVNPMRINNNFKTSAWFRTYWFNICFLTIFFIALIAGLISDAPLLYVLGQFFLAISFFLSMGLLADRPLINPIQFVVINFYMWFGAGPSIVSIFKILIGDINGALEYQKLGMESLWIVSLGLIIFSFISKHTIRWAEKRGIKAKFLIPEGENYKFKSIMILIIISISADMIILLLSKVGIQGIEEVDSFGGTQTNIWWVGIIASFSGLQQFSNCALMVYLSKSWKKIPKRILFLGLFVILYSVGNALLQGSKGAILSLFLYIMVAWISRNQRIPWKIFIPVMLIYFLIVEPYVAMGRFLAETSGVISSTEQKEVFKNMLMTGDIYNVQSFKDINIASPFRGIYELAGDITRHNDFFEGEWNGYTLVWGLEAIIPRAILPEKRDLNVGNFIYHTVYSRVHNVIVTSDINNVSPSVPFEFIGNFGYFAGLLSFALIGFFFSLLCCFMLSAKRLHDHPLMPIVILIAMRLEAPLGHWLANVRGLIFPLIMIYIISLLMKHKL